MQSNPADGTHQSEPSSDSLPIPEERYFNLLISALRVCTQYRPKFGKGIAQGFSLSEFQALYAADPFYHWVGLDSPLVYAAHKAAGGITSIYRQLGIGGEWIFRAILQDTLHLSREATTWAYTVPTADGKSRTLTLDGRIELSMVTDEALRQRLHDWMESVMDGLFILILPPERLLQASFLRCARATKVRMPSGKMLILRTQPMPIFITICRFWCCCQAKLIRAWHNGMWRRAGIC